MKKFLCLLVLVLGGLVWHYRTESCHAQEELLRLQGEKEGLSERLGKCEQALESFTEYWQSAKDCICDIVEQI